MEIAEALKLAAKQAGMTRTEIGFKCGIAEQSVRKLMLGKTKPSLPTYLALRRILPRFAELVDGEEAA